MNLNVSPRVRRLLRLFAWGVLAAALTVSLLWVIYLCFRMWAEIIQSGSTWWLLVTLNSATIINAALWVEFIKAWNTKVTD